jgi:hypothetical protein
MILRTPCEAAILPLMAQVSISRGRNISFGFEALSGTWSSWASGILHTEVDLDRCATADAIGITGHVGQHLG